MCRLVYISCLGPNQKSFCLKMEFENLNFTILMYYGHDVSSCLKAIKELNWFAYCFNWKMNQRE